MFASTYQELGIDVEAALEDAEIPQIIIDAGTNPSGELIALPYKKNVNLFMYRRSIAKQVWGTDDPDTVAELIGSGTEKWDKFLKAAEKLKDHGIYILPSYQNLACFIDTNISFDTGSNGSFQLNPTWEAYMDNSKNLLEKGLISNTYPTTEEWFKALNGKGDKPVFGFFTEDNELSWLSGWLEATSGDWAVCLPPVSMDTGFYQGFKDLDYYTGIMVNRDSKNKDVLGPLIEWITLDHTETGLQVRLANGTFHDGEDESAYGGKRTVVSGTVLLNTDNSNALLGGQNVNKLVYKALQTPTKKHGAGFDLLFDWYYKTEDYLRGETDKEAALAEFKQSCLNTLKNDENDKDGFFPGGKLESLVKTRQLNIYSYDSLLVEFVKEYAQSHPEFNCKVNLINASQVDSYCILSLINLNMQSSGSDIVDIYCVPDAYSHEMIHGDYSRHASPYRELGIDVEAAIKKAGIPQNIIDIGTNPDGELIALPLVANPVVFLYRRSIARDVWGTDDPDEIARIIGGGTDEWENFLKAAQTLKGRGCYIVPDANNLSWMVDNSEMFDMERIYSNGFSTSVSGPDIRYILDPQWEEFMDVSKYMVDNGYMMRVSNGNEELTAEQSIQEDKPVFGYVYPYDFVKYLSKYEDWFVSNGNDWAICTPPFKTQALSDTGILVNRDSPNKNILGPLIEWLTLDSLKTGFQYSLVTNTLYSEISEPDLYNYFGGKWPVISSTLMKDTVCDIDFLGGQNISPIVEEIISASTGKHSFNDGYQSVVFSLWVRA
ncbi:MAG: extracellular solute-binding protein, partial [Thermoclostridium sp.]|nr:extracellular solute-binding protein [Thermoclostridium sp.]